jgi:hypothetical protein
VKLAITRIVLWCLVCIVVFQTLLSTLRHDASWADYASLVVALAFLLLVYMKAIAHFVPDSRQRARG